MYNNTHIYLCKLSHTQTLTRTNTHTHTHALTQAYISTNNRLQDFQHQCKNPDSRMNLA